MPLRFLLPFLALLLLVALFLLELGEGQGPTQAAAPEPSTLATPQDVPVENEEEDAVDRDGMDRQAYWRAMHAVPAGVRWAQHERRNSEQRWRARQDPPAGPALGRWVEVGPDNQAGKTHCVAVSRDGTLYLGSAAGGVWKGDLEGTDWQPLSDAVGSGVDEILCWPSGLPGGPDGLLVRRGARLTWSPDGGQTWHPSEGLRSLSQGLRLVHQGDTVYLLGIAAHRRSGRTTLFASEDRGATFAVRYRAPGRWRGDLLARSDGPEGPDLLWVQRQRILQSLDGGHSWTSRGRLPVVGSMGLLRRGGQESSVYIAILSQSVPGQNLWRLFVADDVTLRAEERGNLPECWRSLAAMPRSSGVLWTGGLEAHSSLDGGRTFQQANRWQDFYANPDHALHADVRGIQAFLDPHNAAGELLFVHTDGGTYLSRDAGRSFQNLCRKGLRVGQVYDTLTQEGGQPFLWIGTQDQGLQGGPYDARAARPGLAAVEQWVSGDYGYLTSIPAQGLQPAGLLASYPGFVLWFDAKRKVGQRLFWPEEAQTHWMPPLARDPLDAQAAYGLAERLYRFQRDETGIWTVRPLPGLDLAHEAGDTLVALGSVPGAQTLYAADDSGALWRSRDGGQSFERRGQTIDPEQGHYVLARRIWVDGGQTQRLWVAGSGYQGSAVLESLDGGASFQPVGAGLPPTLVHDLARGADGRMFAACDAGPWVYDPGTDRWQSLENAHCPNTVYCSVERIEGGRILRFGTFGRGVWDFHLP